MDPFDTDERRDDRIRQRRLLRLMPATSINLGKLPRARGHVDDEDLALLEEWLRSCVDKELGTVKGLVKELTEASITQIGDRFIASLSGRSAYFIGGPFDSFIQELREAVKKSKRREPPSEAASEAFQRLVVLLVLADEASDDNYEDPRVSRLRANED